MDAKLSAREFQNPMLTLHRIFSSNLLFEIRNDLSAAEKHLLDRSFPHTEGSIPYDNTQFLFEQIDMILQASHLLYRMHVDSLVNDYDTDNFSDN